MNAQTVSSDLGLPYSEEQCFDAAENHFSKKDEHENAGGVALWMEVSGCQME